VPFSVGMVGLIYNTSIVKEKPDSWAVMWDEKYKNDVLTFNNPRDSFAIAQFLLGQDINSTKKSDWDKAANLLKEQMELQILDIFLFELEKDLPKKMTEEETKEYILYTIESLKMNEPDKFNKGLLMKTLKSNSNVDMSLAAKLLKEMGK
jgi:spermidine/putrescine-binding protein